MTMGEQIKFVTEEYKRRAAAGEISVNTLKCATNSYDLLMEFWRDIPLTELNRTKWDEFQDWFEAAHPGMCQSNLKKQFRFLCRSIHERGLISNSFTIQNRFARREVSARRKKKNWYYTQSEIDALDRACESLSERVQLRLAYLMAFRISDVCKLTWDRIILTEKFAYVDFGGDDDKANTIAQCPIPPSLLADILELPKRSQWVFPQGRNVNKRIHSQQINFAALKRRAGVKRGTFHSLRHYCLSRDFNNPNLTAAQVCKMRRVSLQVAHSTYVHMNENDMIKLNQETR